MKLSTDHILTTHVGSLPRPASILDFLTRQADGASYDRVQGDAAIRQAIGDVVARQAAIGIHVVSDGELGKPGYANYIVDRLTGFAEEDPHEPVRVSQDLRDYPELARKLALMRGPRIGKRWRC